MEESFILDKARDLTASLFADSGVELVDLTYRRESGGMVLRFTVDKSVGISIGDCGQLSRKIEALLDEANIIEDAYILEVQSPGLDRKLVKTSDFERAIGKEIMVFAYAPVDGKKEHIGKLKWANDEKIIIETFVAAEIEIPRNIIAKAKLYIKF
ncbi:MAG: ribosome maturation factor RimP [Candidatus Omnitrophota bacterium]